MKLLLFAILLISSLAINGCKSSGGSAASSSDGGSPGEDGGGEDSPEDATPIPGLMGEIDTSFNSTGFLMFQTKVSGTAKPGVPRDMEVDSNGRIVIMLDVIDGSDRYCEVRRYTAAGVLDNSFNGTGIFQKNDFSGFDVCFSKFLKIGANDEVYAFASSKVSAGGLTDPIIFKLTENGGLDGSYGTGGIYTGVSSGASEKNPSMALTSDGIIYYTGGPTNESMAFVTKVLADGTKDTSFGTGGSYAFDDIFASSEDDVVHGVFPKPSGKIEVVGSSTSGFWVSRLNSDGSIDTTFGTSGFFTIANATQFLDPIYAMAMPGGGYVGAVHDHLNSPASNAYFYINSDYSAVSLKYQPNVTGDGSDHAVISFDLHANSGVYGVSDNQTISKIGIYSLTSSGSYNSDFASNGILSITDINQDTSDDTLRFPVVALTNQNTMFVAVCKYINSTTYEFYLVKIK